MAFTLDWRSLQPPVRTPLQELGPVLLKAEAEQPSGSAAYRFVYARVVAAIREGSITRDAVLTEASQGNVGLALAHVGHQLGLPVELHCGPDVNDTAERALQDLGARLVKHSSSHVLPGILEELASRAQRGECFHLGQYQRDALLEGYAALGREVVEQIASLRTRPAMFVCPIGTGGLIQGVGSQLRRSFPEIRIVAVEAPPQQHYAGTIRNTASLHMGPRDPYDRSFPDDTWFIEDRSEDPTWRGVALGVVGAATARLVERHDVSLALIITPQ